MCQTSVKALGMSVSMFIRIGPGSMYVYGSIRQYELNIILMVHKRPLEWHIEQVHPI